jgi:glycosyltransferase involved in cell wall biosynthesis
MPSLSKMSESALFDVSVVTSGHHVADARLHRLAHGLLGAGLSVEVLAVGNPTEAPHGVKFRPVAGNRSRSGGESRSLGRRAYRAAVLPFRARGQVILTLDPDLAPAAALARFFRRRRLVVDVHEDYAALLADRPWAQGMVRRVAVLVVRVATAIAARADLTIVADTHLPPIAARQRIVARNLPDVSELPSPGPIVGEPRAVYVGDVRRSRGLQVMVEAIMMTPDWTLDIIGPVAESDSRWLDQHDQPTRCHRHGRLSPAQTWERASGAWVGLAMLEDTPAFREAVPTKLYEYLGAGLAVVVSPLPRMMDIVTEANAGVIARDATELAVALRGWSADHASLQRCRDGAKVWSEAHLRGSSPFRDAAAEISALVPR